MGERDTALKAVTLMVQEGKTPEPSWEQMSHHEWRWIICATWTAFLTRSLGDGTWSFRINHSGQCALPDRAAAEEGLRKELLLKMRTLVSQANHNDLALLSLHYSSGDPP